MRDQCDVAIVGGGPAGLAAAIELKRLGVERVDVIERDTEAGGVPRHCGHPPFGMREFGRVLTGPRYAARLVEVARRAGVSIHLRHSATALHPGGQIDIATPDGRRTTTARRVILATGARETPRSARMIGGVRPIGVVNTGALQAYVHLQGLRPFTRPVIVGTELVGLSAVATCLSHGMRPVAVIETGADPVARWPLTLFPRLTGVPLHLRTEIEEILGTARVEGVRVIDHESGRRRIIDCDGVVLTGEFLPEASLVRAAAIEWDPASGGPVIDQHGRCSDPVYFAAGNLLRPIETAGWSFREGRRIGKAVAADLVAPASVPLHSIRMHPGPGIRYVVPQRVSLMSGSEPLPRLQLRVSEPTRGTLLLRSHAQILARRRVASQPERRILFDAPATSLSPDMTKLRLEVHRHA